MQLTNTPSFIKFSVVPSSFVDANISSFDKETYVTESAKCIYMGNEPKDSYHDFTTDELEEMHLDNESLIKKFDVYKEVLLKKEIDHHTSFSCIIDCRNLKAIKLNREYIQLPEMIYHSIVKSLKGTTKKRYGINRYKHCLHYHKPEYIKQMKVDFKSMTTLHVLDALPDTLSIQEVAAFIQQVDYELAMFQELLSQTSSNDVIIVEETHSNNTNELISFLLD